MLKTFEARSSLRFAGDKLQADCRLSFLRSRVSR